MKFGIKNKRTDDFEVLTRFEILAQQLNKLGIPKQNNETKKEISNLDSSFLHQFQGLAFDFLELAKNKDNSITDEQHEALLELANDKSIVITKADKGNAVVVLNKEDYNDKLLQKFTKESDQQVQDRESFTAFLKFTKLIIL